MREREREREKRLLKYAYNIKDEGMCYVTVNILGIFICVTCYLLLYHCRIHKSL
jgi:hypothetical protein